VIPKVNPEPTLPQKTGGLTLAGLEQYDRDFLNRTREEMRAHAFAINRLIPQRGFWLPTLTAATPGNLAVTYTTQIGRYETWDGWTEVDFELQTASWTHTTASGDLRITGLPFVPGPESVTYYGLISLFSGFTSANFTQLGARVVQSEGVASLVKSGSAQAAAAVPVTDFPTGGTVRLIGSIRYRTETL
jgi:hypothetical protein